MYLGDSSIKFIWEGGTAFADPLPLHLTIKHGFKCSKGDINVVRVGCQDACACRYVGSILLLQV